MAKTSRKLLLALLTILVCLALLVAGAYALFTADFGVTNHLVAGNLTATLTRDSLETVTLGANGSLVKTTDEADADFSQPTNANLFGIDGDARIAPECSYTANMILSNGGSVAFSYWIEVKLSAASNKLAEQLEVTVKVGETSYTQFLSNGLEVQKDAGIGVVHVGEQAEFSVTVKFVNLTDGTNNEAQNQTVDFDFVVHLVQDSSVTNA